MPQLILPLEIILLAATAYLFWKTRELWQQGSTISRNRADDAPGFDAVEMADDINQILADIQSLTATLQKDLRGQLRDFQAITADAETTRADLRTLIDEAKTAGFFSSAVEKSRSTRTITSPLRMEPSSWANEHFSAADSLDPRVKSAAKATSRFQLEPGKSAIQASRSPASLVPTANRYQTVFALADQGFNPVAIAEQTNLEQEAIRMLLKLEQRSQIE